jgi:hypothetical protein
VYSANYDIVPYEIDLCILATSADIRFEILTQLVSRFRVLNIILEKVLFQKIEHYGRVQSLLESHNINCWVNHPLRLNPAFQKLKVSLAADHNELSCQVYGQNWGLGCNSLHWIDLIEYLTEERLISIDTALLNGNTIPSKRSGFIEFKGTILAKFSSGTTLQLTDAPSLDSQGNHYDYDP